MANPRKQKGTAAETAVVDYLNSHGFAGVERRTLSGKNDKGDVAGIPWLCLEVKNHKQMQLAQWVDEAEIERRNAKARFGAVWHKRIGRTDPGLWYVTMSGETFTEFAWHMNRLLR